MQPWMFLLLPATFCAAPDGEAVYPPVSDRVAAIVDTGFNNTLREAWENGQRWEPFYEAVDARRALWVETWTNARVPDELRVRASAAGGPWRILVITEPGCSDSANSIPYIAKLVDEVATLDLRLVDSKVGRTWMEAHRSPDDRAATPTILVLDHAFEIRGCWIEQPVGLQAIWLPIVARGTMSEEVGKKMAWYAEDKGRTTLTEFIEVLEGAHSGDVICPGFR
jgi:hypothetical protein